MLALSKPAAAHEQRLIEAGLHVSAESSLLVLLCCDGCSMTAPAAVCKPPPAECAVLVCML
jgi:hypothetical protein